MTVIAFTLCLEMADLVIPKCQAVKLDTVFNTAKVTMVRKFRSVNLGITTGE